ncbi:MAG: NUDIX domain-containing protein [Anaerolineales bacterium]|nr:NUDIX domain-containing protein [Anaerolineales bacterium]MCB0028928.1 NUDIX domain-containing protein [Anaerolineales bacterium]
MAEIIYGERVGREGKLAIGCSAWVCDETSKKVLLVKRVDNGRWVVPGGYMEAGENLTETCKREVWEESGIEIQVGRLIAVYTNPHMLLTFPDGNKWQLVVMHFAGTVCGGQLTASEETVQAGFYSQEEISQLNLGEFDRLRVADGWRLQEATLLRENVRI